MVTSLKTIKGGKMTASETLKISLGLIFGIAADAAVSAVMGGMMPAGKGWKHLLRIGGVFVLAMMAGERAEEYVCRVFDDTKAALIEAKQEMKEDPEAQKTEE